MMNNVNTDANPLGDKSERSYLGMMDNIDNASELAFNDPKPDTEKKTFIEDNYDDIL